MKIICVGRNYVMHAKELGNDIPESPVIFLKPETALLRNNEPFFLPDFSKDIHHEVEVVLRINRLGKGIDEKFAHRYYDQITLGIDFTARDLQSQLKEKGLPWELSKGFDRSAVIGNFVEYDAQSAKPITFALYKNGMKVQEGDTRQMIFSFDKIISYVSKYYTLKIGDLVYTGTPAGVAKVNAEDRLEGFIGEQKMFDFKVK